MAGAQGRTTATGVAAVGLFLLLSVAWGFNYIFVVIGLEQAAPLWLAALRASVGFLGVAAFTLAVRPARVLDAAGRRDALLLGLPNTALFFGLWFVAAASVPAGETAILIYTFPLWVALMSPWVLGHHLSARHIVAIVLGFAGVAVISQPWSIGSSSVAPLPLAELLSAAVLWAVGTVLFQRRFHGSAELTEANLYQLAGGAVALLAAALVVSPGQIPPPSATVLASVVWLGLVGTAFAYAVWFELLGRIRAATLSAYTFLVPLVTLVAAAIVFREQFPPVDIVGIGLVLLSIYLIGSAGAPGRPPSAPAAIAPGARPELSRGVAIPVAEPPERLDAP
ncbi:MAG: DMT family transporter [Thermoplasmata archaeon]